MDKSRFSMLLLEPGEIYFEDFSCTMSETVLLNKERSKQGRLKLCSKSLVFESRDIACPLVKLHFKDCTEISIVEAKGMEDPKNVINVKVQQYSEMLADNVLSPYNFVYQNKDFYFFFDFANAEECLSQMQQLVRASTLHAPEHNSMIATILHSRYMRMVFDPVMMDDFTEQIELELPAEKISPLVRHQGKLALTKTTLYFQPFNNIEISPILKLKLRDMRRMYKRRFLLRQVGLEIYSDEDSLLPHIYLTFQSSGDRDLLYSVLEQSSVTNLKKILTEEMTMQWQNGIVSNYDYLLYLNCLADRSKNDLTQYPVFPWVVADYKSDTLDLNDTSTFRDLSQPMGALNPDRLEKLQERYHEMAEPKFLYGSHYSAPGLVLFYLVRKYPQYMLCLQNGRFDHPDRMFNSIAHVYNNCLKNMSDFKELVPEFYDTDAKGDFLVNVHEIEFGERHDGSRVRDVALPPWAASPAQCVAALREALESQHVSRHLHLWIDLIFGHKQRGKEAIKANNVFYHVCYEGAVDLELVSNMNDRHALEVQIMEFGQVPKQLFTKPHVRRLAPQIEKPLTNEENNCGSVYKVECLDVVRLHREEVTCAVLDGRKLISVGKDGTLKVYDTEKKKQIRSVVLCTAPLSSCVVIDKNVVACGSWNNEIYLYDVEYGRVIDSFRAHDDSVSCLLWLPEERWVVSGGWDGVARAWGGGGRGGAGAKGGAGGLRSLLAELDHDGKVTALAYRKCGFSQVEVICGTSDGEVVVWRVCVSRGGGRVEARVAAHAGPVAAVRVAGSRLLSAGHAGDLCVTDLSVEHAVFRKQLSGAVASLCWDGSHVLWVGGADGSLLQWNMHTVTQTGMDSIHQGTVNSIFCYIEENSPVLVTSSADRSVKLWRLQVKS